MTDVDIQAIIDEYLERGRVMYPDPWLDYCRSLNGKPINEIVKSAASARYPNGKMNPHQRRQGDKKLSEFADALLKRAVEIDACSAFPELITLVREVGYHIPKIGEMTCYDTADRIRAAKGIDLDAVYLHAGTLIGAKNLPITIKSHKLTYEDLPPAFRALSYEEIENILCIKFSKPDVCNGDGSSSASGCKQPKRRIGGCNNFL